ELAGRVPERLEHLGDGWVFLLETERGPRQADLGQAGPQAVLAGDERRPARSAALLRVVVGEHHALLGHAVDVWRLVAHDPVRVSADVRLADVVAPNDADVRLLAVGLEPRGHLLVVGGEGGPVSPLTAGCDGRG